MKRKPTDVIVRTGKKIRRVPKMPSITPKTMRMLRRKRNVLKILVLLLSIIIPFSVLYFLNPKTFEATWKGRTFYLFFLWLVSLEIILNWEELQKERVGTLKFVRKIVFIAALCIPTVYVIVANFYGLNEIIKDLAKQLNIFWAESMPLSMEYLVFTGLFALAILSAYGLSGLKSFSISTLFLGIIGVIYTIDNIYPYGEFTPFQIFVPPTATLAANILSLMGYQTEWTGKMLGTPVLKVSNSNTAEFGIAWPCSGVESFLIYAATILLFLKKTYIPWKHRLIYFVIGAIVTYFVNILRIVTIFLIAVNGGDVSQFHDYYGPLYSITWIISYPLMIIGSRALWGKIRNWNTDTQDVRGST